MSRRQTKITGICSRVTTRPRRVRRSVSGQSIDVQGKVVVEKSWVFEGESVNYDSMETLSETDTGQDDWCKKHTWFLSTNLLSSQLCAKCNKRILTRRAAYKCTACKCLCHLKCAFKTKEENSFSKNKPTARGDNMDFEQFMSIKPTDQIEVDGDYTDGRQHPLQHVDQNMNLTSLKQLYTLENGTDEQVHPLTWTNGSNPSANRGKNKNGAAKHRVNNMRHSFVKKCRSFKKKVTDLKDKRGHVEKKQTVGSTMELCEDMTDGAEAAWAASPVRTRLQQRQLNLKQQQQEQQHQQQHHQQQHQQQQQHHQQHQQQHQQQQKTGRSTSIRRQLSQHKKPTYLRRNDKMDTELDSIKDRLDTVEQKIHVLEQSVTNEVAQWRSLGQKFQEDEQTCRQFKSDVPVQESYSNTSVKHLDTEPIPTSVSSGTTSDELFVVGQDASSSSPDDNQLPRRHVIHSSHATDHVTGHVTRTEEEEQLHSLGFYSQEDSLLPSGISKRLRMDIPSDLSGAYNDQHTTSTPVTNREISFRSASRQYEQTQNIVHTNVTKVNVNTSLTEPNYTKSYDTKQKVDRRSPSQKSRSSTSPSYNRSLSNSSHKKVLSPHQVAVRSFLEKRRSSDSFHITPQPRSPSPTECVERCLSNRSCSRHTSPGIVRSPNLTTSPPMANSTFRNGQNTSMSSPASCTFRNDFVDGSQASFEKIEANEEPKLAGANLHESSASNLSYTFRNDSQMIRSYGEEDLPGFTRNHSFGQTAARNANDAREHALGNHHSPGNQNKITVEVDIEMDAPRQKVPLAEARPVSPQSIMNKRTSDDGGSLTNVTELTGDFASSFAESAAESHTKSRWINKDVHLFRREAENSPVVTTGRVDEMGDGRKPPLPSKRSQRSSSDFDFLKEAEKSLNRYKNRKSSDSATDYSPVTLQSLPRPSALDTDSTTDDGSEVKEVVLEAFTSQRNEAIVAANIEKAVDHVKGTDTECISQSQKKQNFSADELEEIDRQVNEATQIQRQYGHLMTSMERLESQIILQKPVTNGDYSKSGASSIRSDAKSSKSDVAKYHFLNDKGMVKISSPGMEILIDSPANKKYRGARCSDINEESSLDILESGSEISGIVVDNYFRTSAALEAAHSRDVPCETHRSPRRQSNEGTSRSSTATELARNDACDEMLRNQAELENAVFEECLKTVDNHDAMSNVLQWMNKDYMEPNETEELEEELQTLVKQIGDDEEESARGELSMADGSVYYSFQGQSGELRQLLSPQTQAVSADINSEPDDDRFMGLIDTIMNGTTEDVANILASDRTICESEIKEALLWALENRNLPVTNLLLEDIQKLLVAAEHYKVIDVYPAYRESNRWRPIFVVLSKKDVAGEWDLFMGLSVYRRSYDLVSQEVSLLTENEIVMSNPLSEETFHEIQQIVHQSGLQQHHSRITAISPSICRSMKGGREIRQELCVVIHCPVKGFIPFFEDPFPSDICGIPVDVRQGRLDGVCASSTIIDQTVEGQMTGRQIHSRSHSPVAESAGATSGSSQCLSGSNSELSVRTQSHDDLLQQTLSIKCHSADRPNKPTHEINEQADVPGVMAVSRVMEIQEDDYLDLDGGLLLRTLTNVDAEEAKVMDKVAFVIVVLLISLVAYFTN